MTEAVSYGTYQQPMTREEAIIRLCIYGVCALAWVVFQWRIFNKADKPGWVCLIPIFNTWVLYDIICGRGTAMLRLFIPIYNIYWHCKAQIKLAHAYGKSTAFGVGLILLPLIFQGILAFGSAEYGGPEDM